MSAHHLVLSLRGRTFFRHINYSTRYNLCYITNQKSACSTIKLALQRAELDDPQYTPEKIHNRTISPLCFGNEQSLRYLETAIDSGFVFSFVRNPYTRLLSAFMNKLHTKNKKGAFREIAGFDADYRPSFAEFVSRIQNKKYLYANQHWQPQTENLMRQTIPYNYIGKLESFDQDWTHVAERAGLPSWCLTVDVMNASTTARNHSRRKEKVVGLYSEDLVRTVYDLFQDDFLQLGYDRQPPFDVTKRAEPPEPTGAERTPRAGTK